MIPSPKFKSCNVVLQPPAVLIFFTGGASEFWLPLCSENGNLVSNFISLTLSNFEEDVFISVFSLLSSDFSLSSWFNNKSDRFWDRPDFSAGKLTSELHESFGVVSPEELKEVDFLLDLDEGLDWLDDFFLLSMIGRHDFSFSCFFIFAFCCILIKRFLALIILKSVNRRKQLLMFTVFNTTLSKTCRSKSDTANSSVYQSLHCLVIIQKFF